MDENSTFVHRLIEGNAITLLRSGERGLFEAKVHLLLALHEAELVEV